MPYVRVETNQVLDAQEKREFVQKVSSFVAGIFNKPEKVVMVSFFDGTVMSFAGSSDPAAFVSIKKIGLEVQKCGDYCSKICEFLKAEISVASDRVFVDFVDLERNKFGWNKKTF